MSLPACLTGKHVTVTLKKDGTAMEIFNRTTKVDVSHEIETAAFNYLGQEEPEEEANYKGATVKVDITQFTKTYMDLIAAQLQKTKADGASGVQLDIQVDFEFQDGTVSWTYPDCTWKNPTIGAEGGKTRASSSMEFHTTKYPQQ